MGVLPDEVVNAIPASKDSIKSTWRTQLTKSKWTLNHWTYQWLSIFPNDIDKEPPVHAKSDPVPYLPDWKMQRWIVFHSFIPMIGQQAFSYITGYKFGPIAAFFYYTVAFKAIAIHQIQCMRKQGQKYGFFDGDKHERDGIPDNSVSKVIYSLAGTVAYRMLLATVLTYKKNELPLTSGMNWRWLPLEVGLYGITLDFWFYWYHRIMHDNETMWKYHRRHHLTKHPNPLLSIFADTEQEIFDIAGIPLMTWVTMRAVGLPMGFYEWWLCHQYVVFSELFGHSGVRVVASPPSTLTWLLRLTGTELVVEDHDLHHRVGWKKSSNYGKQTRLWDKIFGTCRERMECREDNIDYDNIAEMPLFAWPKVNPAKVEGAPEGAKVA